MWTIEGEPEYIGSGTGGYDGEWWKWWLCRGDDRTSTLVKVGCHVLLDANVCFEETREAGRTRGRSEVERYLADDIPPREIELFTNSRPRVTHRGPVVD